MAFVLLALAVLLFPVFVVVGADSIPMGGNPGDPSALGRSGVVAAIACGSALAGAAAAVASLRAASTFRAWAALVLDVLVALMSGVMVAAALLDG